MEYLSGLLFNTKDIDHKKGIVSFYFADFNSVDAHGRKIDSKAFNRTINNNKERFAHLLNHDPSNIIGKPIEVGTDGKGAYMVSQLSKATSGRDALIKYEEGIYTEHSFGFRIVKSHEEMIQNDNVEVVEELQMYEASTVTWGANPNTPMISLNQMDELIQNGKLTQQILEKLDTLIARIPATTHNAPQKVENDLTKLLETIKNL